VNAVLLTQVIRLLPGGLRSEGLLALLPEAAHAGIGYGSSWLSGGSQAIAIAVRAWQNEPSWAPWARAAAFDEECVRVRRELETGGTFGVKPSRDDLHAELARVRERLGRYLDVVSWGMVFAYVFYHLMHELCRRWAPDHENECAALTVGLPGVASLEAHYDLRALSPMLAAEPALAAPLAARDLAAAADFLARDSGHAGQAFRRLLERHGHRLTGRDLSCPTWAESPAMVVELAAPGDASAAVSLDRATVAERRLVATARIEQAMSGGLAGAARRALFRTVLANAQRYYALRENMRYHADFFMARLRAIALALGDDLVARGRLTAHDGIFWLEAGELACEDPDLAARADARRRAAAEDERHPPPETLDETSTRPLPAADLPRIHSLAGTIGAPGRRQGRARLVHGAGDFPRVATGDILVAVYTDPGWTPVLERAAGLVLEAGGLLSHGAIVARELGIPALVGVTDAMRAIRDGDLVDLDAASGVVTVTRAG